MRIFVWIFGYGIFLPFYCVIFAIEFTAGNIRDALQDFDKEFLAKYK